MLVDTKAKKEKSHTIRSVSLVKAKAKSQNKEKGIST